jgi:O-antigen/teichoic acid export membrane protein
MLMIITFTLNAVFNLIIGLLVANFLGPADFGRYALAQSIGIVFNTVFIDWLRHSVTRFYKGTNENAPAVRATLELTLGICCIAICVVAGGAILAGVNFGLSLSLALIAPLIGITNGLFDFTTAMLRAEFRNKPYGKAIIIKNILSILLIVSGAAIFQSASLALAGLCVSILASLASIWKYILHPFETTAKASFAHVKIFAIYALPIMFANVLIQSIPLFNRTLLSQTIGFDATGQYSLAYDFGTRIMAGIGSAVDILLLQLAIRADHDFGRESAKKQLSRNLILVFAIMLPLCLGLWLVLPSFAYVLVPAAFQAQFITLFQALLPGFFAYAMLFFGFHQVLFVAQRTWPLFVAGAVALGLNVTLILTSHAVDPVMIAWFQSLSMIAALLIGCLFVFKLFPVAPSLRDAGTVMIAASIMVVSTIWIRSWQPGFTTLLFTSILGAIIYTTMLLSFNTAGLRTKLKYLMK